MDTLLDCGATLANRRWYVNTLLLGDHFDRDDDTSFDEMILRLDCLPFWVNEDAITADVIRSPGDLDRREFELHLARPARQEATVGNRAIALDFRWSKQEVDLTGYDIRQWPQIEIRYDSLSTLPDVTADLSAVYNFAALCVDRAPKFEAVHLYRADRPELSLGGTPFPGTKRRIHLKARYDRFDEGGRATSLTADKVFAPFAEIGGIRTLAKWLDLSPQLTRIFHDLGCPGR